ncbi:hypothetical protein E2K99_00450 [Herbaspirillum huttiense]|uniref:hypothetical protein n=1 Tax=Herbaspirillum huttiense TaxID=863372 RepID=UPI0010662528|nr:hypothetical protein [Herbaspirillum huttiense]QBP73582.1 hypothetical protein E2K99_00450 [Herbaspirillum huttiense]
MKDALLSSVGWQSHTIATQQFDIVTAAPTGRLGDTLTVYLEGDGRAYLNSSLPSADPTPADPVALKMAIVDPSSGPLLYIARPCQYVLPDYGRNCGKQYWTDQRYSLPIVDSISEALDHEKERVAASRLILVGYSGGGALAALLAGHRQDVAAIVTVAANLDLGYWIKRDGLAPLDGSLDPADYAERIADIPQLHLAGARDTVVGPDVTRSFLGRMGTGQKARMSIISDFDHVCCWAIHWRSLIQRPDVAAVLGRIPAF